MKIPPNLAKKIFPGLLILLTLPFLSDAQTTAPKLTPKQEAISHLVHDQNYVFKAQSAMPLSGRTRPLTSDYDVKITKEAIISYLPYFGRAYSAPMDPTQGGIQFTSKDFTYTVTEKKKGGWDIVIKPKDYRDVQQMTLSISSDGYTLLQVTSTNRQAISFNGIIVAPKPPKK